MQRIDGQWAEWSSWDSCSLSCGDGVQSRHRKCTNPSPTNGGVTCSGQVNESRACTIQICPRWFAGNDCSDVLKLGLSRGSGVYKITPWNMHREFDVYCDMDTEVGGWTVMSDLYLLSQTATRMDINHQPFTTYDRDVDQAPSDNCAKNMEVAGGSMSACAIT
ncbi:SSPO-like protein [Mya arenaria]|uniref:SSPO-like protein n=1 Tax=Mya arenaria TaxID=6604 RepID=A0ABY7G7U0_MYAAR|nr:SSPO-like protein [Mya arenaria]